MVANAIAWVIVALGVLGACETIYLSRRGWL